VNRRSFSSKSTIQISHEGFLGEAFSFCRASFSYIDRPHLSFLLQSASMKLAIIGRSPIALEAALRFHLHGASLTWFVDEDDVTLFRSTDLAVDAFTSDVGKGILAEMSEIYQPNRFSWKEWCESYERPLMNYLRAHQEIRNDEVVSITKRFLAPREEIQGRSRFLDLFRVIFKVNPKDFIEEQKDSNPETYKRLSDEFINSLATSIEMYQDYDLILDISSDLKKASASISGRALGEGRKSAKVHYALDGLRFATALKAQEGIRELALIGSDSLSAEILLSLEEWLKEERSNLFIVTTEEEPFKQFLEKAETKTGNSLKLLIDRMEKEFKHQVDFFLEKLRSWQELDDFVQAKIPRPSEPVPRLSFFSGHNVTAIDELIDKRRLFLTLEKPEFREGKLHPENNALDLKTIGVDEILVGHGKKMKECCILDPLEKGFFELTPEKPNMMSAWEKDLSKLEGIENEIFKLFSPVDVH
jgi:hypothetical protein